MDPATVPAPPPPAEPHRPNRGPLVIGLIALVLILLAAYFAFGRDSKPAVTVNPVAAPVVPAVPGSSFSAAGVSTVELDGFSGNITVTATATTQISDTAQSSTPLYQLDKATHTLRLFCANGSCPSANYIITMPPHVGLILHQVSGQAQLIGISGPVDITASSANTMATGLQTPDFTAVITSGRLDASFATVPGKVSVSVVSAQADLHLPGTAHYAVAQQVDSGNVQVAVPQDPNSPDTVDATVTSGQINLLTNS